MLSPSDWSIFISACAIVTVAPGPDNLFVLSQGMTRGQHPALAAAWGMCSGISLHTLAASLGVSAIIYASPLFYTGLKYLGSLYLLFLAVMTIRERGIREESAAIPAIERTLGQLYRRGFLMNVLNPKVGVFFVAFLPQFVPDHSENKSLTMLVLGLFFMLQAFVIFSLIALFSGRLGEWLKQYRWLDIVLNLLTATLFLFLAIRLLMSDIHP